MDAIAAYFVKNRDKYLLAVLEHVGISALSLAAACLVALPLGVLCARSPRVRAFVTGLFSTFRIIPSLAILLLCIPIMGTGLKPAITALVFLAVPPLLINTTLAFSTLPQPVLEAARGIGMGAARTFLWVKAPLALPLILAGFKTATVEVIASATLAAYIGGGGLGTIIFTGLGLMRTELLLIGGISVATLSILADYALSRLEAAFTV